MLSNLGIGIDDMFVIVQCWDTLEDKRKSRPQSHLNYLDIHDRLGETLSHAGVAITITSITDIIAFGIGGLTVLPALMSFCLYASVGIVATYFFQCTFFVGEYFFQPQVHTHELINLHISHFILTLALRQDIISKNVAVMTPITTPN